MLRKISVSGSLPVSVERAKERLRIDSNDSDTDLDALIRTAVATVEDHTGRVLQASSWEFTLGCWPGCHPISLPLSPIRSVSEFAYLDEDGVEQIVTGSDWYWTRTDDGADLRFISGYSYPTLYDRRGSDRLTVRFDAGYDDLEASGSGDDPDLLMPMQAEMAALFLVGTWFAQREHVQTDQQFEVPETFKYLANQLRIFR